MGRSCGTLDHRDERFDDERSNHLISAVLKVEVAIRGVEAGQLIEVTHSIDGGADCGTTYTPGELWLLPGDYFGPMRLKDMPSVEQIAAWRQLPHVPKPVESASASDCRPYTPSREELIEDLRHGNLSFIGTVAGVRREDTTLLTEVPICPAGGGPALRPPASSSGRTSWGCSLRSRPACAVFRPGAPTKSAYGRVIFARHTCPATTGC